MNSYDKNRLLRELPSVDDLIRKDGLKKSSSLFSNSLITEAARSAIEDARGEILSGNKTGFTIDDIERFAVKRAFEMLSPGMTKVINASGTILHTNIGRAVLSKDAIADLLFFADGNLNLEFDLDTGARGERDSRAEGLIRRFTGAEASCVVNNNAAAVLLTLNTLADGREVIISRGELIEIGGSFRLPEIIRKSGCVLKEVGTTNRTHPRDYSEAISSETALIFKAHTSNYKVVGFTSEVELKDLISIGHERGVPVVEDLGSGALVDLSAYGLPKEPVVRESLDAGADVVTFSGDKLLGGPQAGLIAGRSDKVAQIRKNPLKRALRADKLTLAALEATLRLYYNKETLPETLPTLKYMTRPLAEIEETARKAQVLLQEALGKAYEVGIEDEVSVVGGGSLPGHNLPTKVVTIAGEASPEKISRIFLDSRPAILGRIKRDRFMLDMRTIEDPSRAVPSKL